jgi:hypothetical protein
MTPTPTTDSAVSPVSDERMKQLQFEVSAIEPSRRISMSSEDRRDLLSIFAELALSRRSLDTADGVEGQWPLGEALKIAEAYIGEYEFDDGEHVFHSPSETERLVMIDMVNGLFSEDDFIKALASRTPNTEMAGAFVFDRYVNGQLMAEGVTVEQQATLQSAMQVAARIAAKGPKGETPVLVLTTRPAPNTEMVVKALEWRGPFEAFPSTMWEAETSFGRYEIEEQNASDSPVYELRFNMRVIAIKDGVPEIQECAQADFDQRIRSALASPPSPAEVTPEPERVPHEVALAGFYEAQKADVKAKPLYDQCVAIYKAMRAAALQLNKKG